MTNADRHREAHRRFNEREWDSLTEMVSPSVSFHDHPRDIAMNDADGFVGWLKGWATTFSDARVDGADYIDAGEWTIARFIGRGLNDGPLGEMPATGKQMNMPFCEIMHWSDGKIERGELYYDQLTMLSQLGVMQSMPA